MIKDYLCAALLAFAVALVTCKLLIPLLRRLKAGQNVLSYVKEHQGKGGTPTFGGLAFLPAAVVICLPFGVQAQRTFVIACVIGLAYLCVGFLDDFLKKKRRENLGLTAGQKLLFQTLVAVVAGIYCVKSGRSYLRVPFTGIVWEIGWWMLPLSVLTFLATVNAVNLTDGLDGLAAGVSAPFFACIGLLIFLSGEEEGLAMLSFSIVGALLAYLLFNTNKASIFMGDTGSLSLGGFASAVCLLSGNALYIPIVGLMFVLSVISVVVQVIYYKVTHGKRIFLMSPIHHHFQQKGYSEGKIAYAYTLVTLVLGVLCVVAKL